LCRIFSFILFNRNLLGLFFFFNLLEIRLVLLLWDIFLDYDGFHGDGKLVNCFLWFIRSCRCVVGFLNIDIILNIICLSHYRILHRTCLYPNRILLNILMLFKINHHIFLFPKVYRELHNASIVNGILEYTWSIVWLFSRGVWLFCRIMNVLWLFLFRFVFVKVFYLVNLWHQVDLTNFTF